MFFDFNCAIMLTISELLKSYTVLFPKILIILLPESGVISFFSIQCSIKLMIVFFISLLFFLLTGELENTRASPSRIVTNLICNLSKIS